MIMQDVAANVVLMFVLMTLADDWDSVNNEARDDIEKT